MTKKVDKIFKTQVDNGLPAAIRLGLREEVNGIFKEEINKLIADNINSQEVFDLWHRNVSDIIKSIYAEKGILLTYGQAQNMWNYVSE